MTNIQLRSAHNISVRSTDVDKAARSRLKGQRPAVLWFTGLSGAGKSTIANVLEVKLAALGYHTYLLDGDSVRGGLNMDLGFTDSDRAENIRRVAEVARLMVDAGLIVIASLISPFRSQRAMAREKVSSGEFIEIYIDTALAIAEERDVKGLYKKARRGEIADFTGISSPYEAPDHAEVVVETRSNTPEQSAEGIVNYLRALGLIA
jgi:bifunctional enzyme CysN/CysC